MMKISQVLYELFESEANSPDLEGLTAVHELDREIRLVGENGQSQYISWIWDPSLESYVIGLSNESYFVQPPTLVHDVTDSVIWSQLADQSVSFVFVHGDTPVLEIHGDEKTIYCWAQTNTLCVSGQPRSEKVR
ncbi:MAG: hypothetical protein ABI947_12050 [Chloroflexota bacterium]